jgi:hypothetical protein
MWMRLQFRLRRTGPQYPILVVGLDQPPAFLVVEGNHAELWWLTLTQ